MVPTVNCILRIKNFKIKITECVVQKKYKILYLNKFNTCIHIFLPTYLNIKMGSYL